MTRAIAVALLLLALPVSAGQNSIYPGAEPGGSLSADPAPTCSADLSLGGYDVINNRTSLAADTAPDASTLKPGQSAWSQATVNTTGAAAAVCGGVGRRFVTITAYTTSANDTLTVTVYSNATSAATVLTAGTSFACQALASNAACALALKTYLLATPIAGVTASCTDGTCSDAKVFLQPAPDVCDVTLAWSDAGGGGVAGTATSGDNGQLLMQSGTRSKPSLAYGAEPGTGWYRSGTGNIYLTDGTRDIGFIVGATSYVNTTVNLIINALSQIEFGISGTNHAKLQAAQFQVAASSGSKGTWTNIGNGTGSSQVLTCLGGGSATLVTSGLIPKGATLFGVSTRITSAGLTGPTSMDVGDGSDVDLYADDTAVTDNSTSGDAASTKIATANWGNPQLAAGEVTLTFNGGACTAGTIRVTAHLATITAATVD
jgi:hypothetical protein